jgi:hypothetical protein
MIKNILSSAWDSLGKKDVATSRLSQLLFIFATSFVAIGLWSDAPRVNIPAEDSVEISLTPVIYQQGDVVLDITFDDLKFDLEKEQKFDPAMLTDKIREMEGKRILIRGYMQPSFRQKGIKSFVFVRDNKECCFGPGAALFDCMIVKLKKGESTTFQVRPFAVEGQLAIDEYEGPDGNLWAIFHLKDAIVK